MKLSDDLAEAIGQVAVNAIIESVLCRRDEAEPSLVIWNANACEQIGTTILERFDVKRK